MFEKIAFIGAGSMAEAIVAGLVQAPELIRPENIVMTNKVNEVRLQEMRDKYEVTAIFDKAEVIKNSEIVFLSMKPKDLEDALSEISPHLTAQQVIISVIAGVPESRIRELIGKNSPIIRTMPNTSAMIGESATGIAQGTYATSAHVEQAEALFQTIGTTVVVSEEQLHAVTSISGSGPAYFYKMVEAMEDAAIEVGLEPMIAKDLIVQTIIGAGKMLEETGMSPETLRKNITSPGGTTNAAITKLDELDFENIVKSCVKSAYNRSIEMSKE